MSLPNREFELAALSLILAALLWTLTFLIQPLNFWIMLSLSTSILMLTSIMVNRERLRPSLSWSNLLVGVSSALLLYAFFFAGFQAGKSLAIITEGVGQVYALRSSASALVVAIALVFPIAPGEEFYWRGLVQRRFSERFGKGVGLFLAVSAYALVHLPTLNPSLVMAAFFGGLVWGVIYQRTGSLATVVVSHAIWDLIIFVILPLV